MGIGADLQLEAEVASALGIPFMESKMGQKFSDGSLVRVIDVAPVGDERDKYPTWTEGMDSLVGKVGTVVEYDAKSDDYYVEFVGVANNYYFRPDWLEPGLPDLPDPNEVFEKPVPAEPDPKRRRVSNALYAVLADVTRLEGDFEYQYGYARELVEELAQVKKDAAEVNSKLDAAVAAEHYEREAHTRNIRLWKEKQAVLETMVYKARRPSRALKLLAISGWLAAVLSGGVLAFEKISATPVDTLVKQTIMNLHDATSE